MKLPMLGLMQPNRPTWKFYTWQNQRYR